MKILMVLTNKFPVDIRVQNEAVSLHENGHEVGLLSTYPYDKDQDIMYKGIKVHQRKINGWLLNKMKGLAGMAPFLDKFLSKEIGKLVENEGYKAIHLHDLYLFGAVPYLKRKYNLFYVGDMHENYVEVVRDYGWAQKFPNNLIVSKKKWERKELEWMPQLDRAITVSEGIRQRMEEKGVKKEHTLVVPNSISPKVFDDFEYDEKIITSLEGTFNLVYVGGFVSNRGLEHVIEGFSKINKKIKEARLILVGDGSMLSSLKAQVNKLNLDSVVRFEGRHTHEKIKSYLKGSHIGLVPFKRTPQTDNASSNKVFQYMYYELPLLSTNCNTIKSLVEKEEVGIVYESENVNQFVEAVLHLYNNPSLMRKYGEKGREAVIERYNWESTVSDMLKMYKQADAEIKT